MGRLTPIGLSLFLLLPLLWLGPSACVTQRAEPPPNLAYRGDLDGLEAVRDLTIRYAYRRPAARLSDYSRVELQVVVADPLDSEFDRYTPEALERAREIFERELRAALGSGYEVVDASGPEVLSIRAEITALLVNRPRFDISPRYPARRWRHQFHQVGMAGMQLAMQDSDSGELLVAWVDRRFGRNITENLYLEREWGDAEFFFKMWSNHLRATLDAAHIEGT